ncbi:SIMPL domain-containing protein [Pseudidiomarina insulisalsae]|uniref:SIMPL domain-containing protein n=1 Tax=Pseudidiomarina insulisalsae TaxID=575789 RepID=A0A432YI28_9GAMM|nr:SIMPL domain-containing protein [Pseudidiomarina insulisalsae]RUO60555.1 hypothetical protein CWI71_06720 [Pseudidiomarina insulisalsae]
MRRLIPFFMIAASLSLVACQPAPEVTPSTLTVAGSATVEATPDEVQLTLNIERSGMDIPALKAHVDDITANLLNYLRQQGVAERHIQSYAIRLFPQYRYTEGEQKLTGYQVNRRMVVDFTEPQLHTDFLEYALRNGVQRINEPSYRISDAEELYRQTVAQAIMNARAKAEHMATAAGTQIIGIREIRESMQQAPVMRYRMAEMSDSGSNVSLPGQQTVEAQVEVIFLLARQN